MGEANLEVMPSSQKKNETVSNENRASGSPLEKRYKTKEAMDFLNMSKSDLDKKAAKGVITSHKPGGKIRYFWESDLLEYINRNRKGIPPALQAPNYLKAKKGGKS